MYMYSITEPASTCNAPKHVWMNLAKQSRFRPSDGNRRRLIHSS